MNVYTAPAITELGTWIVVFFDLWKTEPIFHRHGDWKRDTPQAEVDATACGRATWHQVERSGHRIGTGIPMAHAVKFGRPCRICFPGDSNTDTKAGE